MCVTVIIVNHPSLEVPKPKYKSLVVKKQTNRERDAMSYRVPIGLGGDVRSCKTI